jgi:hypothetical protein
MRTEKKYAGLTYWHLFSGAGSTAWGETARIIHCGHIPDGTCCHTCTVPVWSTGCINEPRSFACVGRRLGIKKKYGQESPYGDWQSR